MKKIKNSIKKSLDRISQFYCEDFGFEKVLIKYKIKSIKPHLKGSSLLDVGCGVGYLCKAFSDKFAVVVGLDGSRKKIEKAKKLNFRSNITYFESLIENFKSQRFFDTIIATNILEHVKNPNKFLKKLKSLLSKKGRIVITVPNALSLHKRIGKYLGIINDFYLLTHEDIKKGHQRIYDQERLIKELTKSGFRRISIEGVLLKPLSNHQMVLWDSKICDALFKIGKELPDYCSSLLAVAERK